MSEQEAVKKSNSKIVIIIISVVVGFFFLISVLAVGALVLIPRLGVIKNKSKEAGVRANVLKLEGEIQSVIDEFDASDEGISDFEKKIKEDINSTKETNDETKKFRNPVTGAEGVVDSSAISQGGAFAYYIDVDDSEKLIDLGWPEQEENLKGMVAFGAYKNESTGKVVVKLIPYDGTGHRIQELEKVISQ